MIFFFIYPIFFLPLFTLSSLLLPFLSSYLDILSVVNIYSNHFNCHLDRFIFISQWFCLFFFFVSTMLNKTLRNTLILSSYQLLLIASYCPSEKLLKLIKIVVLINYDQYESKYFINHLLCVIISLLVSTREFARLFLKKKYTFDHLNPGIKQKTQSKNSLYNFKFHNYFSRFAWLFIILY